ncbi:caspase family protein [Streptomyces massasporeus]|uniref:caspase family protein n=1 Tax=Streptomyces massasporeus TaxID=67324 RepID=UPI0037206FDB
MAGEPAPFDPERSRAVLIGCSTYQAGFKKDGLSDLPSVPHSLDAMRDLLDEWGLPSRNCDTLSDRNGPLTVDLVRRALRNAALESDEPSDLLIVYYSGHGYTIDPPSGQGLYLALSTTDSVTDRYGSLPFSLIASILQDPRVQADHIMVILDCCHAGAAALNVPRMLQQPGESAEKITLLVAADKGLKAKSPVDDGPSFFTSALVEAARQPAPRSRPYLSLSDLALSVKHQVDKHNNGLNFVDLEKRVPTPLTLYGHVADHPWLPNKAFAKSNSVDAPLPSVKAEHAAASTSVSSLEHVVEAAESVPLTEKVAPLGLKWPWEYTPSHPIVARPTEFARLQAQSRPQNVVPITGEPGVGKRHLVELFLSAPDGSRSAMPKDPYVLQLDLDLIRYKSPVPALRALQFALGLTRYRNGSIPLNDHNFTEAREQAVAELNMRARGRPLVLYITFRATRSEYRKVYDDLERLLKYPIFRNALVLIVSVRGLESLDGGGQLIPSAAVNVPALDSEQAAELLRLLLEERSMPGLDPAAALQLFEKESIAYRPVVLRQAVANLNRRLSVGDAEPDNGMLAEEIRRAIHYVVEPALIEAGCRLEESAGPGALALLLAWTQLGSPPLSATDLPTKLGSLQRAIPWLRKSGVVINEVVDDMSSRVVIGPAAAEAFREIHRRLQLPPSDRFGKNRLPEGLLGVPEPDEARVDEIIGEATAHLLNHIHEYTGTRAEEDEFKMVRALEQALDELDEITGRSASTERSNTRSIVVANLLARSDETLILPVDLDDAAAELAALRDNSSPVTRETLSPLQMGIAQLNVLSRLSAETPEIRDNLSQVLTQIWEEASRKPLMSHKDINRLDRLTAICADSLGALDDVIEFRTIVLDLASATSVQDYSFGRTSRILALAGWGLATADLSDDDEILRNTAQRVQSLLDSLEESFKVNPGGGLLNLMRRLSLLHARISQSPQEKAKHLLEALQHGQESGHLLFSRELEDMLDRLLHEEDAEKVLGSLLAAIFTSESEAHKEVPPPSVRWQTAARITNIYKRNRTALPAEERLSALNEVAQFVGSHPTTTKDELAFSAFFISVTASIRDVQGDYCELLRDLKSLKAALDQALTETSNWMILRGWLTIVSLIRERSWTGALTHCAGPALEQWTTRVRAASSPDARDAWATLRGLELILEAESPLALPGPRALEHAPSDDHTEQIRSAYDERRVKIASFGQSYGQDITWFRMHRALEHRFLHEEADATGRGIDVQAFQRIYASLNGKQPRPVAEFNVMRAKDELAAGLFHKAAKTAEPKRKSIPEHRLGELVCIRADALLRQALWTLPPGESQRHLLETVRRELAELPQAAPGHWSSVLRLRAARAYAPSSTLQFDAISDLDALFTTEGNAPFFELAAALADMGEETSVTERQPFTSALEAAGANLESVNQLALLYLEQAEWLCGFVPSKSRTLNGISAPSFRRPSAGREEQCLAMSLLSAWSCFSAVVWLSTHTWSDRVQSAMGQGRVLALASLVWGEDASDVLRLGQGYPYSCEELGHILLSFVQRHSTENSLKTAKLLSKVIRNRQP